MTGRALLYLLVFGLIGALLPAALFFGFARAADEKCFDHEGWRRALSNADAAAAIDILEKGIGDCVCETEINSCLPYPGSGKLLAPAWLRDITERLSEWTASTQKACGALPEGDAEAEQAKWKCYRERAVSFADGLAGEADGRLIANLPVEIADQLTRQLERLPQDETPGEQAPAAKKYSAEAREIGQRICLFDTRLRETQEMLERVKRRGQMAASESDRREEELQKAVKELNDTLLALRQKFLRLTGEVFNAYAFCGPQTDPMVR